LSKEDLNIEAAVGITPAAFTKASRMGMPKL
jgi:hypothetical protein